MPGKHNLQHLLARSRFTLAGAIHYVPGYGHMYAWGTSAPTNSVTGYAPGCVYHNLAGTSLDNTLYINTGTGSSSVWEPHATGLLDYKGGYNASTNTPDLDTSPSGVKKGDSYVVTAAGSFFTTTVAIGDMLIAEQDDADAIGEWTIVEKNVDWSNIAETTNLMDDIQLGFGAAAHAQWETADANANAMVLALPEGGATDVPVYVIGTQGAPTVVNADLGFFDGVTQTTLALLDADNDSYFAFDFSADDSPRIRLGGSAVTLTMPPLDFGDDEFLTFGGVAKLGWETADANANALILQLPTGGATDVPVFAIGTADVTVLIDDDLGFFDGVTETTLALVDADGDSWFKVHYSADDTPELIAGGAASTIDFGNRLIVGTSGVKFTNFTTGDNIFQVYATDATATGYTDGFSSSLYATAGNGAGALRPFQGYGEASASSDLAELYGGSFYAKLVDGGKVRSNMYAVMGWMEVEETDAADAPNGYVAGLLGIYDTNGVDPSVTLTTPGGKAAVLGCIKDNANSTPHAAMLAFMEGDATGTAVPAAFKAVSVRSTAGGGFTYGLDLYDEAGHGENIQTADIRLFGGQTIHGLTAGDITLPNAHLALGDDNFIKFGGAAQLGWETADANANALILQLPTGGATDVPVFAIGTADATAILNADLGFFDGTTETTLALVDADGDSWFKIDYSADDTPRLSAGGAATEILLDTHIRHGGRINQDAYIVVEDAATDSARGTNLKAAYTAAKSLTPGGSALSATNRAVVIVPAGRYDFGSTALDVDTDFVDFVGVGECRRSEDGTLRMPDTALICDTDDEVVNVTARDVHMSGFHIIHETAAKVGLRIDEANAADRARFVDIGITNNGVLDQAVDDGTNTDIGSYFENCHTVSNLLGECATVSGTLVYCSGGDDSFAGAGYVASGTFIDCHVEGVNGFAGSGGTASGTFKRCTASGNNAFGGSGTASGTFEYCSCDGQSAFGGNGVASGTFRNCVSGTESFGSNDTASGTFIDCESTGIDSFGFNATASGTFIRCRSGQDSFGTDGTISGSFTDCIGGNGSFRSGSETGANAKLIRCICEEFDGSMENFQGTMEGCRFIATGSNVDILTLAPLTTGTSRTDSNMANSSTTVICLQDNDYTSDFPVGDYVKNATDGTWHRIVSAAMGDGGDADGNDDTLVTVTPAAVTQFDGLAVQAHHAPKIYNNTLVASGTGDSINAASSTPAVVTHMRTNKALNANVVNVVLTNHYNVVDAGVVA